MNPETSDGRRLIASVWYEGPTSVGKTIVAMIDAEDWTEGSCSGGSSLGVQLTGTKSCDGNFSRRGLEDAVQRKGHAYSEGLELVESASVSEILEVVPRWAERTAQEQLECLSCSSSSFRYHGVEVWREGLVSSTYSGVE